MVEGLLSKDSFGAVMLRADKLIDYKNPIRYDCLKGTLDIPSHIIEEIIQSVGGLSADKRQHIDLRYSAEFAEFVCDCTMVNGETQHLPFEFIPLITSKLYSLLCQPTFSILSIYSTRYPFWFDDDIIRIVNDYHSQYGCGRIVVNLFKIDDMGGDETEVGDEDELVFEAELEMAINHLQVITATIATEMKLKNHLVDIVIEYTGLEKMLRAYGMYNKCRYIRIINHLSSMFKSVDNNSNTRIIITG